MTELLSVRELGVSALIGGQRVPVIRRLSFNLQGSKVLGLVGESGAGKSMVGRAIANLLPPGFTISSGACLFQGADLVRMSPEARRALLGREIAFIPQSPQTALDPLQTIGRQFDTHLHRVGVTTGKERRAQALAMLAAAHLHAPDRILDSYPHQLSGGMCQRVLVAMAFASSPRLVIADEATTALDVTIQLHILRLIAQMQRRHQTALIFITHNLRIAAQICDEIIVMYGGAAVEVGHAREVLANPAHPYSRCLELADPSTTNRTLFLLPEQMPGLLQLARMSGCAFAPRCPHAIDECRRTAPALAELRSGHSAACIRVSATADIATKANAIQPSPPASPGEPILCVEALSKCYSATRGRFFGRTNVIAVKNVSFSIGANEFVALVGESGSGKSTIARLLVGLEQPTFGRILINGVDTTGPSRRAHALRIATVQMIFQNSQSALNPRRRIAGIVTQAMEAGSHHASLEERLARTRELLAEVGMSPELATRYPPQLSGGQRQRVNIARALCARPKLLVADEIVSGLDVSVQAQLLTLLSRLRAELGFGMLFISHDLSAVRYLCDRILVMCGGEIVEHGRTEDVFTNPQHSYTRALLAALPPANPSKPWIPLVAGTPANTFANQNV